MRLQQARDQFQGLYSNFEAETLDNKTFHYTHDFHQKGMPQKSCKMHNIATVNPNNGKIISTKIMMTGQSTNEISQYNKKYIETAEKNIEAYKTPLASTRSQNTNNKYVGNVPSSAAAASPVAGSMNHFDLNII